MLQQKIKFRIESPKFTNANHWEGELKNLYFEKIKLSLMKVLTVSQECGKIFLFNFHTIKGSYHDC